MHSGEACDFAERVQAGLASQVAHPDRIAPPDAVLPRSWHRMRASWSSAASSDEAYIS